MNVIADTHIVWLERNLSLVRERLFLPCANNKGPDQPAHPRSLISTFVVYSLDSIIPVVAMY